VGGAESRAGAVADAAVEGHTNHCDVGTTDILKAGQSREGGDSGIPRHHARVYRTDRLLILGHVSLLLST
jgi:hypothetical protein